MLESLSHVVVDAFNSVKKGTGQNAWESLSSDIAEISKGVKKKVWVSSHEIFLLLPCVLTRTKLLNYANIWHLLIALSIHRFTHVY